MTAFVRAIQIQARTEVARLPYHEQNGTKIAAWMFVSVPLPPLVMHFTLGASAGIPLGRMRRSYTSNKDKMQYAHCDQTHLEST